MCMNENINTHSCYVAFSSFAFKEVCYIIIFISRFWRVMSVPTVIWFVCSNYQNWKRLSSNIFRSITFSSCPLPNVIVMNINWEDFLFYQVIDYRTLPTGDRVSDERRALTRNMWTQRIQGAKSNVEVEWLFLHKMYMYA